MTISSRFESSQTIADLLSKVANQKTTLLLSGGSSAVVGVGALKLLDESDQKNITVLLADERYVAYGSEDSNANLLITLGILDNCNEFVGVLTKDNISRSEAAENFSENLQSAMQESSCLVAVLGVGADNHTAGILPETEAAKSEAEYVVGYATDKFERITIAPNFFKNIDYAFVYAEGADKEDAMQAIEQDFDSVSYPSQLVKKTKHWQVLFNKENT